MTCGRRQLTALGIAWAGKSGPQRARRSNVTGTAAMRDAARGTRRGAGARSQWAHGGLAGGDAGAARYTRPDVLAGDALQESQVRVGGCVPREARGQFTIRRADARAAADRRAATRPLPRARRRRRAVRR